MVAIQHSRSTCEVDTVHLRVATGQRGERELRERRYAAGGGAAEHRAELPMSGKVKVCVGRFRV
jgi:hypothetical protein